MGEGGERSAKRVCSGSHKKCIVWSRMCLKKATGLDSKGSIV